VLDGAIWEGRQEPDYLLDEGVMAALEDCLELRGDHPGALFHPTVKGGRISPRRMSDQTQAGGKAAGLQDFIRQGNPQNFSRCPFSELGVRIHE